MTALNVRQRGAWREIVAVIAAEVPHICNVMAACSHKEAVTGVKLGKVNVTSVLLIRIICHEVDANLRVVVQCVRLRHGLVAIHGLVDTCHHLLAVLQMSSCLANHRG